MSAVVSKARASSTTGYRGKGSSSSCGTRASPRRLPVRSRQTLRAQEELEQAQGQHPGEDGTVRGREPRARHRRSEPGAARLVRHLQAGSSDHIRRHRWVRPTTAAVDASQAAEEIAHRLRHVDPQDMAKRLLRECRVVRTQNSLAISETAPMWKPPPGEPCAGKPHVRCGGRGGDEPSRPLS